jgi:hypothetical protein
VCGEKKGIVYVCGEKKSIAPFNIRFAEEEEECLK